MAQTDAPPAEATPPPAPEAQPQAPQTQTPPAQREAPPGQRSTGGERPQDAQPGSTPLNRETAQDLMRRAYKRTGRDAPAAKPADQVDESPQEGVQEAPTPASKADAPADATARGRDASGRFQKAPAEARRPTPEPPSPEPPVEAPDAVVAPAAAAPEARPAEEAPGEDFRSERWQAAIADDPGLRRRAARISADPTLSPGRKAEMLSEKLLESVEGVRAEQVRAQQINDFRQRDPTGYTRWEQQQEAVAEQNRQLELRITRMIADAYGVDASDPDFLEAGPQDGDADAETGLQRFVAFTSRKSPRLQGIVQEAVAAKEREVAAKYEARLKAAEERHKTAMEAAVERARGQARSPYGTVRRPPRANGTGQRPVGEDDGLQVAQKAPDVGTVRGLIGLGYDRRKPSP